VHDERALRSSIYWPIRERIGRERFDRYNEPQRVTA
jgi:hypothetical protein